MGFFPKFTLVAFASLHATQAAFVLRDWTLQTKTIAPDGFNRSAALINGVNHCPLLKPNKGDTVRVLVHNELHDPNMRQSTGIVSPFSLSIKYS